MTDHIDYKEAYFAMARAAEQVIRNLETMQQETAKIMLNLIQAQQKAEELLISQDVPNEDYEDE